MTARADLAALIEPGAPDTWTIYPYPTRLRTFEDETAPVAVVIEQRGLTSGTFSPDLNGIPVQVELLVWVIVDGARGDDESTIEDDLEAAAEEMIRLLEPLPDHVWDGQAQREAYDPQKPAYQFTIRATGDLTP